MKEIPMENLSNEERASALNEAEILRKLNHPNIIRYHDSFLTNSNQLTIVMEFGQGGTLYDFLAEQNNNPLPEASVKQLFLQLLVAVHYRMIANQKHLESLLGENFTKSCLCFISTPSKFYIATSKQKISFWINAESA